MNTTTFLDEKNFLQNRRSLLLEFANYKEFIEDAAFAYKTVTNEALASRSTSPDCAPADLMASSRGRAWQTIQNIHVQYSAGLPIQLLADFFPTAIEYWEIFAEYDKAYDLTPEAGGRKVPHLDLYDKDYWRAIRLASWAVLLGHTSLLQRVCALWDYENDDLDGLLERLVAPYVPGRAPPPDECTRHLPYFKLLKVFGATPEKRPAMMAKYMEEWYQASRREPYHGGHLQGREHGFFGYWSFEAAATSIVLDIDDTSYRDHEFYPRDMADFARALNNSGNPKTGEETTTLRRLNVHAGSPCPEDGWWFTPAQANSRRFFKEGAIMPALDSDYGATFWQWSPDQAAPKL